MRTAVIFDVHGNLAALEAVLADAEAAGAQGYAIGGDLALFGPEPAACVDRLRGLANAVFVQGNTDRYLAERRDMDPVPWFVERLGDERVAWLGSLPTRQELAEHDALVVHATPRGDEEILNDETPDAEAAAMVAGVTARTLLGRPRPPAVPAAGRRRRGRQPGLGRPPLRRRPAGGVGAARRRRARAAAHGLRRRPRDRGRGGVGQPGAGGRGAASAGGAGLGGSAGGVPVGRSRPTAAARAASAGSLAGGQALLRRCARLPYPSSDKAPASEHGYRAPLRALARRQQSLTLLVGRAPHCVRRGRSAHALHTLAPMSASSLERRSARSARRRPNS